MVPGVEKEITLIIANDRLRTATQPARGVTSRGVAKGGGARRWEADRLAYCMAAGIKMVLGLNNPLIPKELDNMLQNWTFLSHPCVYYSLLFRSVGQQMRAFEMILRLREWFLPRCH